jgi:hypothetical protein
MSSGSRAISHVNRNGPTGSVNYKQCNKNKTVLFPVSLRGPNTEHPQILNLLRTSMYGVHDCKYCGAAFGCYSNSKFQSLYFNYMSKL